MRYTDAMPDDTPTQRHDDDTDFESELPTVLAPRVALVFHDDSETPSDFVMHVLERYCGKTELEARAIVEAIARKGFAVAGEFPQTTGRVRLAQVQEAAQGRYPFKATLEPIE